MLPFNGPINDFKAVLRQFIKQISQTFLNYGYWMAINICKGFLNFLVTYEKDLFTELAYEKVIDI